MLQGEAKRAYMREWMRRKRAGEPTRKPKPRVERKRKQAEPPEPPAPKCCSILRRACYRPAHLGRQQRRLPARSAFDTSLKVSSIEMRFNLFGGSVNNGTIPPATFADQSRKSPCAGEGRQAHWEGVYAKKVENELSWFEENPAPSLELIAQVGATTTDAGRALLREDGGGASGASRAVNGWSTRLVMAPNNKPGPLAVNVRSQNLACTTSQPITSYSRGLGKISKRSRANSNRIRNKA